jgi:hypothetical protein
MRVIVRLYFARSRRPTSTRESFWYEYANQSETSSERSERDTEDFARRAEESIMSGFVRRLRANILSREVYRRTYSIWSSLGLRGSSIFERIKIDLVAIEYNSLDLILNVLGIDNETIRSTVLEAIELYSPLAIYDCVGRTADLSSEVIAPQNEIPKGSPKALLAVMGTSLLIPCILALLVCYFTFKALTEELEGVRAERQAAKLEQTEMLKVIADQNTKLSASLVEASKNSAGNAKELEQLQLNIIRLRAITLGLLPPDPATSLSAPNATPPTD